MSFLPQRCTHGYIAEDCGACMKAEIERLRAHVKFLAGRVRNAHTLLEHNEYAKAEVLLAETWLEEYMPALPSTENNRG